MTTDRRLCPGCGEPLTLGAGFIPVSLGGVAGELEPGRVALAGRCENPDCPTVESNMAKASPPRLDAND